MTAFVPAKLGRQWLAPWQNTEDVFAIVLALQVRRLVSLKSSKKGIFLHDFSRSLEDSAHPRVFLCKDLVDAPLERGPNLSESCSLFVSAFVLRRCFTSTSASTDVSENFFCFAINYPWWLKNFPHWADENISTTIVVKSFLSASLPCSSFRKCSTSTNSPQDGGESFDCSIVFMTCAPMPFFSVGFVKRPPAVRQNLRRKNACASRSLRKISPTDPLRGCRQNFACVTDLKVELRHAKMLLHFAANNSVLT